MYPTLNKNSWNVFGMRGLHTENVCSDLLWEGDESKQTAGDIKICSSTGLTCQTSLRLPAPRGLRTSSVAKI